MRTIVTSIDIRADREVVWAVLTNFCAYPEWNPFMRQISGRAEPGGRLQVHMSLGHKNGFVFRPVIRRITPLSELSWLGHMGVPGVFDGEHDFKVEACGAGVTRFVQSERFSGLLATLWGWTFRARVVAAFERMNHALRDRAEALSQSLI